eukprot:764443-Hanusia_phi.AAC.4
MSDNVLVIDKRHLWLSKKIANALQVDDVDHVEKQVSTPSILKIVNMFFQANGFRNIENNDAVSTECSKDISFGLFGSHSIKNFNVMIQEVYVPLLEANLLRGQKEIHDNFRNQLSRFSMSLLDLVQTIDSRVRLEKPDPELLALVDLSHTQSNEQAWHQLLKLLGSWYTSAKKVLYYGQEDLNDDRESGPDSTLKFWRERLARLNALQEQLEADESQALLKELKRLESEADSRWDHLFVELREAIQESHENVRHLTSLNRNFEVLYSGNPSKIVDELPSIAAKHEKTGAMKELPFSFNESLIFAKYESLSGLAAVCDQYFAAVNIIKSRHVDLMDFFDQSFDRDFNYFKEIWNKGCEQSSKQTSKKQKLQNNL